jgi:nicotinamidase-related amidase
MARVRGADGGESPPAPGGVGLLLVDVINPMDFEDADGVADAAVAAAGPMRGLRDQADALGVPVVYVNDNYGHWASEKAAIVAACAAASPAGRALVDVLGPRPADYFVIKPQFSGFYATNLPVLLPRLGVNRLVLVGLVADICVLFTAADAHMREYGLWVPGDAVAGLSAERRGWALELMRQSMGAEVRGTDEMSLRAWIG